MPSGRKKNDNRGSAGVVGNLDVPAPPVLLLDIETHATCSALSQKGGIDRHAKAAGLAENDGVGGRFGAERVGSSSARKVTSSLWRPRSNKHCEAKRSKAGDNGERAERPRNEHLKHKPAIHRSRWHAEPLKP
jgi:hypothetical protein